LLARVIVVDKYEEEEEDKTETDELAVEESTEMVKAVEEEELEMVDVVEEKLVVWVCILLVRVEVIKLAVKLIDVDVAL
jgi:hypothetical protein